MVDELLLRPLAVELVAVGTTDSSAFVACLVAVAVEGGVGVARSGPLLGLRSSCGQSRLLRWLWLWRGWWRRSSAVRACSGRRR